MPSKMTLKVEKQVRNPYPVIKSNIVQALQDLAPSVTMNMIMEVPVKSGETRRSIRTVVTVKDEMGTLTAMSGNAKAWYGRFIEWGTVHNKPNPFVLRTFRKMRQTIANAIMAAAKKPV